MKIPQSVRDEIATGPLAHLTTLNRDGSPQVTMIWVGIEGEEFVIGHLALHQKIKNIAGIIGKRLTYKNLTGKNGPAIGAPALS
jgi:predicted pyridoxine 5'-phosphate oxidase superfamily flavin-nucleotide-binding protein